MSTPDKIFSAKQVKEADRFTIREEPITSIDLMERAAFKCVEWIYQHFSKVNRYKIFIGRGNNGGDGLAIARLLMLSGVEVEVFVLRSLKKYSEDFIVNEQRLKQTYPNILHDVFSPNDLPVINPEDSIIDALFGTGLSKPISGLYADCINFINNSGAKVIAIDMPSGLFADIYSGPSSTIIKATYTLSFQFPKLSFFFPENAGYVGDWQVLAIGLSKLFIRNEPTNNYLVTLELVKSLLKPREKFSHKGTFGHALLVAGSYGKIGAAILAVQSCLRSGVGLVTIHAPKCGYEILQCTTPEAMISVDANDLFIQDGISSNDFSSTGIGPGIGMNECTQKALHSLLINTNKPMVLDADALNIIGLHKDWLSIIPANSILTPHPKEFERIAGKTATDFERHQMQIDFSKKYNLFLILKGAHTCITTPLGDSYFNTTGNSGMAKGGSGDILTGILTGLLAQGYHSFEACIIAVYVHGLAGDIAKQKMGEVGMTASDLIQFLPEAFLLMAT